MALICSHPCQWRAICPYCQSQAHRHWLHKFLRNAGFCLTTRDPFVVQFEVRSDCHFSTYALPETQWEPISVRQLKGEGVASPTSETLSRPIRHAVLTADFSPAPPPSPSLQPGTSVSSEIRCHSSVASGQEGRRSGVPSFSVCLQT